MHTATDNNKGKASKTSVKGTAVASKRKTDGNGSAAPSGNIQNEDSNSQTLDSAPPLKKQKTVTLNGQLNICIFVLILS